MITEPVSIGDSLAGTTWFQGIESETEPNIHHPFGGLCKLCERPLDKFWRKIDHPGARGWHAVNCCDICYEAAKKSDAREDANLTWWNDRCPPEFRKPWDSSIGHDRLLQSALKFDPSLRRGLLIVGQSGTGKTRVVWQILKRLTENGLEWYFATALEIMEGLPAEAYRKKVLVIDDLGNDKLTMAKEVELLRVIRQRVDWHQAMIVTTQFKGKALTDRFSEGATAQAIVRRLREFCTIINVDDLLKN